jgi:hypothetical protein
MATVSFVNRTKSTVVAGSYVILKHSRKEDHDLELVKEPDIFASVSADVLPGEWGEAIDLTAGFD